MISECSQLHMCAFPQWLKGSIHARDLRVWEHVTNEDAVAPDGTGELRSRRARPRPFSMGFRLGLPRGCREEPQSSLPPPPLPSSSTLTQTLPQHHMERSGVAQAPATSSPAPWNLGPGSHTLQSRPAPQALGQGRPDKNLESRASSWGPDPNSPSSGSPSAGPRLATRPRQAAGRAACLGPLGDDSHHVEACEGRSSLCACWEAGPEQWAGQGGGRLRGAPQGCTQQGPHECTVNKRLG